MVKREYERLISEVQKRQAAGTLPVRPTREQRISWAYGNAKVENDAVTMEMAVKAVDANPGK